ncbi:hypothetical protein GCM10011326_44800 [Salipiger profundus]|nr:hypothetical protein GCM10011326_44800 [Salipiger profundus]
MNEGIASSKLLICLLEAINRAEIIVAITPEGTINANPGACTETASAVSGLKPIKSPPNLSRKKTALDIINVRSRTHIIIPPFSGSLPDLWRCATKKGIKIILLAIATKVIGVFAMAKLSA